MDIQDRFERDRPERGQILIIFALGLTLLVLVVGLVVDGGNAFVNRRDAQNDADLAAMAGGKIVKDFYVTNPAIRSQDVYAAIDARLNKNDCVAGVGTPCSWTAEYRGAGSVDLDTIALGPVVNNSSPIPPNTLAVKVVVSRQPRTYFLGIVGQTTWQVAAESTAVTYTPNGAAPGTLLPIVTNPPNPFVEGTEYTLSDGNPYGPGAFGWLSWTGANATGILGNSICNPDNPEIAAFPVTFPGDPGAHNGNDVRTCLDYWITTGRQVLIPIFDTCVDCGGNAASYHITGLAVFVLTDYDDGGGPAINSVSGTFVGTYNLSTVPAGAGAMPPSAGSIGAPLQLYR